MVLNHSSSTLWPFTFQVVLTKSKLMVNDQKKTLTSVVKNSKHHFKTPNASKLQDIFVFGNLQSRKLTWQWKMDPFEDVFPIEHGDIPASYVSFPEEKKTKVLLRQNLPPNSELFKGRSPSTWHENLGGNWHIGFWWPSWCLKKNTTLAILRFRDLFGMVVFFCYPNSKVVR